MSKPVPVDPSTPVGVARDSAWRTVRGYLQQATDNATAVDPSVLGVLMDQLEREPLVTEPTPKSDAEVERDAVAYVLALSESRDVEQSRILTDYGPIVGTEAQRLLDTVIRLASRKDLSFEVEVETQ